VAEKIQIGVRIEETLRKLAGWVPAFAPSEKDLKEWSSTARKLVAQLDDARSRKAKAQGINPNHVVNIIRGVLGNAAILPPNWDTGKGRGPLLSLIKYRVQFLGVDEADIERAAARAKATWRLPVSVEWVVKKLDTLLSETHLDEMGVKTEDEGEAFTGRG
jgi:hypothetical protein